MAPTGSSSPFTPCRVITFTILLIIIFSALQVQILSTIHSLKKPRTCTPSPPSSADINSPTPAIRHITRTFREMRHLEDLSKDADEAWRSTLSTPRGGFLIVQNENKEERGGKAEPWGISMFHAIHCLTLLRTAFQHSNDALNTTVMANMNRRTEKYVQKKDEKVDFDATMHDYDPFNSVHVGHCFSYIAQYIMCAADSTIEPPQKSYDKKGKLIDYHVDGEGYQHKCRDPSLLWQTVMNSEKEAVRPFDWAKGDTVENVFGR